MLETCAFMTFPDLQETNGMVPELFCKNVSESLLYI